MPPLPAIRAGTRLLFCLAAALLFFVFMFWLGWTETPAGSASSPPAQQQLKAQSSSDDRLARQIVRHPAESRLARLATLLHDQPPSSPETMHELENLSADPEQAVFIARELMEDRPELAGDIGTIVIGSLLRQSAHAAALELAQCGPESRHIEWITVVLSRWIQDRPEDAELITSQLHAQRVAPATFAQIAEAWAASSPAELARYCLSLSSPGYRNVAILAVLDPWIQRDPSAVAVWIPRLVNPAEQNLALSRLATRTDTAFRSTSQAVAWAESITDPVLQQATLIAVLREWFSQDPVTARQYLDSSPSFDAGQRQQFFASLIPAPEPL